MSGLQASLGIFQPSDFISSGETSTPGFQGLVSYDWQGNSPGSIWGGSLHQKTDSGLNNVPTFDAKGFEVGAKVGMGDFEAVLYAFDGKGLVLATVGALFFSPFGETDGQGYFAQGTYKFGKTKVGINHGQNQDRGGTLLGKNKFKSATFGVYHSLNKYITLVGEYNQERATGPDAINSGGFGNQKTRTISLGGIIFF